MPTRRQFVQSALLLPVVLTTANAFAQDTPKADATQVFADFEGGNYEGWTMEGNAFGDAPATDALFPGKIRGFTGRGFLCSLHKTKGNAATGKAISKEFTIEKPFITFKIGGGNHPSQACINLIVDSQTVRTATGDGTPNLVDASWDVSDLKGKKAYIEIVDATASADRGYIMVDDIRFEGSRRVNFTSVREFNQRVRAVLSKTIVSPTTTGGILQFYALVPPTMETQKLVSCSIRCHEFPDLEISPVKDASGGDKKYIAVKIPMSPRAVTIDIIYVLDLYKVTLRRGSNSEVNDPTPEPTDLRATKTFDYNDAGFKAFLKTNDLTKRPSETNFDFAYRVYSGLSDDLARRYRKGVPFVGMEDFKASFNCKQEFHDGQCGVCALLFVSALRANGVPSRLMVGRWAKNTEGDYGQFHVRSDFYEPSVGWIPVDQTFGYGARQVRGNIDAHFGANAGDFIIMHLNSEISPEATRIYRPVSQFEVFEYKGASPFNPNISEKWTVTKL